MDELNKIKERMIYRSPEDIKKMKETFEAEKEQKRFAFTMRKERMAKLDKIREMKEKPSAQIGRAHV